MERDQRRQRAVLVVRIKQAATAHFGPLAKVRHCQVAATSDAHGFLLVDQDGTFIVADWRLRHDGAIAFSEEAVSTELGAREAFQRRVKYNDLSEHGKLVDLQPDESDAPVEIDVEDALAGLIDIAGSRYRVVLRDAQGQEIASVAGAMVPPEAYELEGVWVARFGVSREGMEATVRFPIDPDSLCASEPGGAVSGKLPNGSSWMATPIR